MCETPEAYDNLPKFCALCGQILLDSDRFCQKCRAAQPTRSPPPAREIDPGSRETALEHVIHDLVSKLDLSVPKEEAYNLLARVEELEAILAASRREAETERGKLQRENKQLNEKLAASVPKIEAKRAEAGLLDKISTLEARLRGSVPLVEVEQLHVRIEELEKKWDASRSESDTLRVNVTQLQSMIKESDTEISVGRQEIKAARKTIEDLQGQLSRSSVKADELQNKLSGLTPASQPEKIKDRREAEVMDSEAKLAASEPKGDVARTRTTVSAVAPQISSQQADQRKPCTICKHMNRFDAVFCAMCGNMSGLFHDPPTGQTKTST